MAAVLWVLRHRRPESPSDGDIHHRALAKGDVKERQRKGDKSKTGGEQQGTMQMELRDGLPAEEGQWRELTTSNETSVIWWRVKEEKTGSSKLYKDIM